MTTKLKKALLGQGNNGTPDLQTTEKSKAWRFRVLSWEEARR